MLFLSRSGDPLPLKMKGWKYGASCFKSTNNQEHCWTRKDCITRKKGYCEKFPQGKGKDLATVVFFRTLSENDPSIFKIHLFGNHAAWGFLLAVNGTNHSNPIRNKSTTSSDNNKQSIFPIVSGNKGDIVLLSMAYDDTAQKSDFRPPKGTQLISFVNGKDEAGFLYSKELKNGTMGAFITGGEGGAAGKVGPENKDALISLVLKG